MALKPEVPALARAWGFLFNDQLQKKMKLLNLTFLCLGVLFISCQEPAEDTPQTISTPEFQNKAHELVYNMVQKVGNYDKWWAKKDVVYTYTYTTPDNKTDVSTEKYIFDGELSYAAYQQHERTLADLEGPIEQGYDGKNFWLKHQGEYLQDDKLMNRVIFNRKTNYYWFAMMPKLLDPGLNYEYVKQDTIDGKTYDVVKVSFDLNNEEPADIYQLYINQETALVDQFLFTVAYFDVQDPLLMKVQYEEIDGLLIPTKRLYTKATWDGKPLNENWIKVTWSDIKFDNGLSREMFEQKS